MQGELTLRLSSSWMYIAYISLLFDLFSPLYWWIDKKGEKYLKSFICMIKVLGEFIYACLIPCLCIYMLFGLCISLTIFIVYCYVWVKGELLWILTLIHAYITPWVLSSSKRGRLLAQWPITLVLMMINSYSYSLLIILWYLVSDIWSRY